MLVSSGRLCPRVSRVLVPPCEDERCWRVRQADGRRRNRSPCSPMHIDVWSKGVATTWAWQSGRAARVTSNFYCPIALRLFIRSLHACRCYCADTVQIRGDGPALSISQPGCEMQCADELMIPTIVSRHDEHSKTTKNVDVAAVQGLAATLVAARFRRRVDVAPTGTALVGTYVVEAQQRSHCPQCPQSAGPTGGSGASGCN